MLCQHCHEHPATVHYSIYDNGRQTEAYLCRDCAQQLSQQYTAELARWWSGLYHSLGENQTAIPIANGQNHAKTKADETFCQRRRLGELRWKLDEAVANEDYETAAKLRDTIRREEQNDYSTTIPIQ